MQSRSTFVSSIIPAWWLKLATLNWEATRVELIGVMRTALRKDGLTNILQSCIEHEIAESGSLSFFQLSDAWPWWGGIIRSGWFLFFQTFGGRLPTAAKVSFLASFEAKRILVNPLNFRSWVPRRIYRLVLKTGWKDCFKRGQPNTGLNQFSCRGTTHVQQIPVGKSYVKLASEIHCVLLPCYKKTNLLFCFSKCLKKSGPI